MSDRGAFVRLTKLYVRFFRSFNFDYERKAQRNARPSDWEKIGDAWFPFVRIDLDPAVTAVVGANESGKSHLIEAIKQALTGRGIARGDFCRYSSLYSVETGRVRVPDLGIEIELQSRSDVDLLAALPIRARRGSTVTVLRLGEGTNAIVDTSGVMHPLDTDAMTSLERSLPKPFELETNVPLPDSISLDALLNRELSIPVGRRARFQIFETLRGLRDRSAEAVAESASQIADGLSQDDPPSEGLGAAITSEQLGRSLLLEVAKIDRSAFEDLERAIRNGEEGQVGGLIEEMNRSLARHLNFTRWWSQDRDFQLRLSPRERELVFTIRDRTGTDYSFRERSRGLMYFLSYFVQLRAHQQEESRSEILLMDEPDAYLSSIGQQDLLRALESFARPDDKSRSDQVIYVTHSPFLINKNFAHRIRVLDKGSNEEGTRVVRDVARNHYEPLRSSIGSYVAETAFIGGANLLVEGVSDQVLLTGLTTLLRVRDISPLRLLDLNDVTIVPAGSASSVPYMAYLARGRDEIKPACIALLDGDRPGREAARKLARSNDGNRRPILDGRYVIDLADWATTCRLELDEGVMPVELEDLIPVSIVVEAARSYAARLLGSSADETGALQPALVLGNLDSNEGRVWKALEVAFSQAFTGAHIEKVGFAKEVVTYIESVRDLTARPAGLHRLEHNFERLLAELAERLHHASRAEAERRAVKRTDRIVGSFLRDYPEATTRDAADQTLRDIEASLEDTSGDEAVRHEIVRMRRDFRLATDPLTLVPDFTAFRERLEGLKVIRRKAYGETAAVAPPKSRRQTVPQGASD